ncbi:MAG: RHS repeat-associated core domain-containing protein [Candidatus Dormibacteria bacterium]
MTVGWIPPASNGGAPITSFTVTAMVGGNSVTSMTVDGSLSQAVVSGLTNGTTYAFEVLATNGTGAGPYSVPSAGVTPSAPTSSATTQGESLYVRLTGDPGAASPHLALTSPIIAGGLGTWTVEGYLGYMSSFGNTGDRFGWGLLSGSSAGPSVDVETAGIHTEENPAQGSWFVWPGSSMTSSCPIPSDPAHSFFPSASLGAPQHFAETYDGTTVRGYVNGTQICAVSAPNGSAAIPSGGAPAGFIDYGVIHTAEFDEMRISSTARYTGTSFTPSRTFSSDSSTVLLTHFDDYKTTGIARINEPWGSSGSIANVFKDSSGNGNTLSFWYGNGCPTGCGYYGYNPVYYTYSLSTAVDPNSIIGGGLPWLCPCTFQTARPVNTATGEFWHTLDDMSVPGRGFPLDLTQTYSSALAGTMGRLGYGWTDSYGMYLEPSTGNVHAANGSFTTFARSGNTFTAAPGVHASLMYTGGSPTAYVLTDPAQNQYSFDSAGRLIAETDRNAYKTVLSYNGSGQLSTVTDPEGRTLTFTYVSGANLIQSVTDTASPVRTVTFAYTSNELVRVTDVGGGQTNFTYTTSNGTAHLLNTMQDPNCSLSPASCTYSNGDGTFTGLKNVYDTNSPLPRVIRQYDDLGRQTSFSYATDGLDTRATVTDPKGNQILYEYLGNQLISETRGYGSPRAATWTYQRDPATFATVGVTDPNGHTSASVRDGNGNVLSSTDALGRTSTLTYNSYAEVLTEQDPIAGAPQTTNLYDVHGNLTQTSRPLSGTSQIPTSRYFYEDPSHPGDMTRMTDPNGNDWRFSYDAATGQVIATTDPLGNRTTNTYDGIGRLTTMVPPDGNVTNGTPATFASTYAVDNFFHTTKVTAPPTAGQTHITASQFDANQNLILSTDANGHQTKFQYDADNEPTLVTRNDGTTRGTSYYPDGAVSQQIDGLGNLTTSQYDELGREVSMTDPLNRRTTYAYDGAGNLTSLVDAMSQQTQYAYDPADELTSVAYAATNTPNVIYTYDADGQRLTMQDGTGTSSYSWDSLHRLTRSQNGAGAALGYVYDLKGQVTSIIYPGGTNGVNRTYDAAGHLKTVTDWLNHTTTYAYDANSNMTGIAYPNQTIAAWTYDPSNRLSAITDSLGGTSFLNLNYNRDQVGQLTAEDAQIDAYNTVNQVTQNGAKTYGYDAADRLTQMASGGTSPTTLTPDAAGQLCWSGSGSGSCASPPAGATTFAYDLNGNRTGRSALASSTSYSYDQANRMVNIAGAATYGYNGDGLRMSKTISGATTQQTWDTAEGLPLEIQDGGTSYITGAGGLPLEQISGNGILYYHVDQLGSTRALTDATGAVVGTCAFDAYGNRTSSTGAVPAFGFAGSIADAESGLIYLRARYYDPATAQFISRDPLVAKTRDPYAYTADNPINRSDPSGLTFNGGGEQVCLASMADCMQGVLGAIHQEGAFQPTADGLDAMANGAGVGEVGSLAVGQPAAAAVFGLTEDVAGLGSFVMTCRDDGFAAKCAKRGGLFLAGLGTGGLARPGARALGGGRWADTFAHACEHAVDAGLGWLSDNLDKLPHSDGPGGLGWDPSYV